MEQTPLVTGNWNGNSPLVWDETMMRAFCRRNQPVLCSSFVQEACITGQLPPRCSHEKVAPLWDDRSVSVRTSSG